MSADNWGVCPKCQVPTLPGYGTVSEAEYLAARQKATAPKLQTLREDYEIFINENGVFRVSYTGACQMCGFKFEFDHTQQT